MTIFSKKTGVLILLMIIYSLINKEISAQLITNSTMTPQQLVQNVLVGQGVTVSNVTVTGSNAAIGSFTSGTTPINIGFQSGVIMASGNITNAIGPNSTSGAGNSLNLSGDALLNTMITNYTTYDATILEFDFIPVSDTIKFRYVFGSEEYPEYVNSSFNDVFGFFVSGLNPLGGTYVNKNIAILPGTTNTPVSINNVNNGTSNGGPCTNCAYYVNNTGGATIEYDGLTTVLTAWCLVMPCFTYHIKLGVADAGDHILDSGVFLEKNSFMSNTVTVNTNYSKPNVDTVAVEGCSDALLTFRIPTPIATNLIVNYAVSGTATNGVDYPAIPNSVTIPAGQDSVVLVISPILDSITEPTEQVLLIVNTSACTYDSIYISIKDNSIIVPIISNDTVICNSSATINISSSGGISPHKYLWSTGDSISTIIVSPPVTTQYKVTITDGCNATETDSMFVIVSKPVATTVDDTVCFGKTGTVSANAVGAVGYLWNTGGTQATFSDNPSSTTTYTVIVTDTLGCTDTADAVILVNPLPVIIISNDTTICEGVSIDLSASGGISYLWNTSETTQTITVSPPNTKSYNVIVIDNNGCENSASMTVDINPIPIAYITAETDTICRGSSTTITAFGGDTYLWNTGSTSQSISAGPKESTNYTVTVSNILNSSVCSDIASFELGVKRCNAYFIPNAFTPDGDGVNDFFGPGGKFKAIEFYEMYIFDRWGKLIFFSDDCFKQWDGTIKGSNGTKIQGVYTYKILIKETYNDLFEFMGTVLLIP